MKQNTPDPLNRISRRLQAVSDRIHEAGGRLSASTLRQIGHELVSLAGELTTLGVDMARQASELDRGSDNLTN